MEWEETQRFRTPEVEAMTRKPTPADIKRQQRRETIEDALMRAPREVVRRRLKLLPSELDDYAGPEDAVPERNPVSGY